MNLPSRSGNRLFLLAFLLSVGVGCTMLPAPEPAAGGFNLRGKLGVVHGEESFSARFLWRQQGRDFTIDLWGPLGQGRVQLTGSDRHLTLREADGTVLSEGPPDAVMTRHLGWSLPLAVLPEWVRGRPAPDVPVRARERDADGQLTGFRQLGWHVTLERYGPVTNDGPDASGDAPAASVPLPHRVTAERDDYRVRLAISDWQL